MPRYPDPLPWLHRTVIGSVGVVAGALAILEGAASLTTMTLEENDVSTVPAGVGIGVCGVLAVAALVSGRTSPVVVYAMAGASIACSLAINQATVRPGGTPGMVELLALAWLGVRVVQVHPPRHSLPMLAALSAATPLTWMRLDDSIDGARRPIFLVGTLIFMAFLGVVGFYLRLRDRMRFDRREYDLQAQRLEYARDLHDFVAHHVTAIVAQTKAVRFTTAAGRRYEPPELDRLLAGIEQAGSEALGSMRDMISALRTDRPAPTAPQVDLTETLAEIVRDFPATGPVLGLTVADEVAHRPVPEATLVAARHIVRESLTNVLRHALDATRVVVRAQLCAGDIDVLQISVQDDGRNLPAGATHTSGFGLVGLRERAEALGGRLAAERRDEGWRVTAQLPLTVAPSVADSVPAGLPSWRP